MSNVKTVVVPTFLTDQYLIITSINKIVFNRNNPPNPKLIKQLDYTKLALALNKYNWFSITNDTDVNSATNDFINTILKETNKCTVEKNIASKTKKIKSWATTAIILSIRRRDIPTTLISKKISTKRQIEKIVYQIQKYIN